MSAKKPTHLKVNLVFNFSLFQFLIIVFFFKSPKSVLLANLLQIGAQNSLFQGEPPNDPLQKFLTFFLAKSTHKGSKNLHWLAFEADIKILIFFSSTYFMYYLPKFIQPLDVTVQRPLMCLNFLFTGFMWYVIF